MDGSWIPVSLTLLEKSDAGRVIFNVQTGLPCSYLNDSDKYPSYDTYVENMATFSSCGDIED